MKYLFREGRERKLAERENDAALQAAAEVIGLWETRVMAGKPPYVGWLEVVDEHQRTVFQRPL